MLPNKLTLQWFSHYLWLAVGFLVICVVSFGFYVRAEKLIDRANDTRLLSFELTDELRDSSDALTRMARSYMVTGDPAYRVQYQQVLDVRDGRRLRVRDLHANYWEVQGSDYPSLAAQPLLTLMRQAGFAAKEIHLLEQSLQASNALAQIEVAAMDWRAQAGSSSPAEREAMLMSLFDADYQRAKLSIMQPIFAVQLSVQQRTLVAVEQAALQALWLRWLYVSLCGLLLLCLFGALRSLRNILGGSLVTVHQRIERLARGDFTALDASVKGHEYSVLGWLARAQVQLAQIAEENLQSKQLAVIADQRFRDIVDTADGIVWEADANTFQFTFMSQKAERLLGFSTQEWLQPGFWVAHVHPDDQVWAPDYCAACTGRLEPHDFEYRFIAKDGQTVWLRDIVTVVAQDGAPRWLRGVMVDISAQKLAEQELRIAAVAFESHDGIIVANNKHQILRVNSAFTRITGYSAAEVVGKDPRFLHSDHQAPEFYADMWRCIRETGIWQGEIWNRRKNGEVYPEYMTLSAVLNNSADISHFVASFSDLSLRKAAANEIHQLAFYDTLTGLPNRRLLLDRLEQTRAASQRNGKQNALLFIDLDNFKQVNDTSGHAVGDLLLQQAGQRLLACVRAGDTVARLGGDEFVVMLEGLDAEVIVAAEQTKRVGEKILASFGLVFLIEEREYQATASIGAVLFSGLDSTIDELLRGADISMYAAKQGGRNALCFFDPAMQASINQRALIRAELQKAILEQQFVLHYQAQCDETGEVVGAEALVRWLHPQRGLVAPNDFIPLAEESGLILLIGHWVLSAACTQLILWAAHRETAHLSLAVNVSAKQFAVPTFVDEVTAQLERTGINPAKLKLELTESLLLENTEVMISKMLALKALGVSFSMDDFGTGYSSLAYLKRLPLDQLKIDRSFVNDVLADDSDAKIAKTIIVLGQSLGLQVIAEGVETREQLAFLVAAGCRLFQGYLFSKPLSLADFEAFLQRECRAPLASNSSVCL
jgi:diguanylate cyclase (GGDEF)-like protein/PAS domain S-box-containing protein